MGGGPPGPWSGWDPEPGIVAPNVVPPPLPLPYLRHVSRLGPSDSLGTLPLVSRHGTVCLRRLVGSDPSLCQRPSYVGRNRGPYLTPDFRSPLVLSGVSIQRVSDPRGRWVPFVKGDSYVNVVSCYICTQICVMYIRHLYTYKWSDRSTTSFSLFSRTPSPDRLRQLLSLKDKSLFSLSYVFFSSLLLLVCSFCFSCLP